MIILGEETIPKVPHPSCGTLFPRITPLLGGTCTPLVQVPPKGGVILGNMVPRDGCGTLGIVASPVYHHHGDIESCLW